MIIEEAIQELTDRLEKAKTLRELEQLDNELTALFNQQARGKPTTRIVETKGDNKMTLQQHFTAWEKLNAKVKQIHNSPDLTPAGQQKALEGIDQQRANLIASAYDAFEAAWADMRKRFTANEKARGAALAAEQGRTDYAGLRYEADRIRAMIANATDANTIREAFNAQKNNSLLARAWRDATEAGISPMIAKDLAGLQREAAENAGKFLSPEMQKVNQNGDALAAEAVQLIADTKAYGVLTAWNTFDTNDLAGLLDGVTETRDYIPGYGFKVTVTIAEPVRASLDAATSSAAAAIDQSTYKIRAG